MSPAPRLALLLPRFVALAPVRVLGAAVSIAALATACRDEPVDGAPPAPGNPAPVGTDLGAATLLATGFELTEGPLWSDEFGGLLFTSLSRPSWTCEGAIHLLTRSEDGTWRARRYREPSCNANGLARDVEGRLLAAQHGSRSVARRLANGSWEAIAESHEGVPLNAPNDLAVRSDGTIYFTDPDFVRRWPDGPGFEGLYRIDPGGELHLEAKLPGPNGVALSPDERTLYATLMEAGELIAFTVAEDGTLDDRRVLVRGLESPDGLAVDGGGNLYVATGSGEAGLVLWLAPTGARWGAVGVPEPVQNCALGEADRRTLFVAAGGSIYAKRVSVPGP